MLGHARTQTLPSSHALRASSLTLSLSPPKFTGPPGPPTGATAFAATPFTLAHPRTGTPSQFLLVDGRVYEASLFRPPTGAWFAGEGVVSGKHTRDTASQLRKRRARELMGEGTRRRGASSSRAAVCAI